MNFALPPIDNQTIVITGASSGLGRGAALKFAAAGATLVLAARRTELLDELVQECQTAGGRAVAVPTDVSRPEEILQLATKAVEAFGRIDTWINNAGVGAIGPFEQVPVEDHRQVIETNLLGTLYGSHAAMRQFLKQGQGNLINVASMLGKVPAPYYASYNASKHGVIGLSQTLRLELEQQKIDNIHICLVLPMAMNTPFFAHAGNYTGHESVPIPPTDDVGKVIDILFDLTEKPQDEVFVGAAGKVSELFHQIMPGMVESMTARLVHTEQMEKALLKGNTAGNIHAPLPGGAGVRDEKLLKG